jgi:hypothetical protein
MLKIANLLIKNFQNFPNPGNFDNWEVFNHLDYLNGNSKVKKLFRLTLTIGAKLYSGL